MKNHVSKLKNPIFLRAALGVLVIIFLAGLLFYYENSHDRISIENSLISAPIITVSPNSSGKLKELDVTEGQVIKKGDQLAVLDNETVRSDTDGLIISANNLTGSSVSTQTQLIQMINPVDLRVTGTIDENKGLNQIHVGQVASFTVDAFPGKTYWGYIDEISPSAKQTQLSFSISSERPTQQFIVYARFNSSENPEIKNGMSAKMTVFTKTH